MTKPVLLSGGNPQIAKGYGEAPVRAYLAAVPGWKQAACRRIDEIVSQEVPGVVKAVKWNSPFYGLEQDLWFLSFHCYDRFVKVSFYKGAELSPPPAVTSKFPTIRYHHVQEGDALGEQFADWVRKASRLPGTRM
jgi:hypothetical protein